MTATELRIFLEEEGLSQVELAMLLEINPRTVRRYVLRESEIPKVIELACEGLAALKEEGETEVNAAIIPDLAVGEIYGNL